MTRYVLVDTISEMVFIDQKLKVAACVVRQEEEYS